MIRRALLISLALAAPVVAEEAIVSGLSQSRVSITTNFDGSEILVYGAVKRESPAPEGSINVIITVQGPSTPVTVRRKDRVAGIWINNEAVKVDSAPSFYAVATSGPLDSILSKTDSLRYKIGIDNAIKAIGAASEADNSAEFIQALLRVRSDEGRYRLLEGQVQVSEDTLFRTDVALPANLMEGEYTVRLFLLRDGKVVAQQSRAIDVRKEGLERLVYSLAKEQPLAYGLLSLAMAVAAGLAASTAFKFLRR